MAHAARQRAVERQAPIEEQPPAEIDGRFRRLRRVPQEPNGGCAISARGRAGDRRCDLRGLRPIVVAFVTAGRHRRRPIRVVRPVDLDARTYAASARMSGDRRSVERIIASRTGENHAHRVARLFRPVVSRTARADETCMSPYMAKIVGQEDFVYVWTLGMVGVGDEQDKLVTVDVNPKSANYGKVVASRVGGRPQRSAPLRAHRRPAVPVGDRARHQPHLHLRRRTPIRRSPKLVKHDRRLRCKTSGGVVGPHTSYALPGRMLLTGLSNNRDHGGRTAMVRIHQRRRIRRDALDADRRRAAGRRQNRQDRRRLRLRRRARCRASTCSSARRSPAGTTT